MSKRRRGIRESRNAIARHLEEERQFTCAGELSPGGQDTQDQPTELVIRAQSSPFRAAAAGRLEVWGGLSSWRGARHHYVQVGDVKPFTISRAALLSLFALRPIKVQGRQIEDGRIRQPGTLVQRRHNRVPIPSHRYWRT